LLCQRQRVENQRGFRGRAAAQFLERAVEFDLGLLVIGPVTLDVTRICKAAVNHWRKPVE
jgi:hypothetical protein